MRVNVVILFQENHSGVPEERKDDVSKYSPLFTRVQNGNDVRGAAIATEDEKKTLTPGLVSFIAAAFAQFLSEKTGKKKEDLRIGVGHDSRVTAGILS